MKIMKNDLGEHKFKQIGFNRTNVVYVQNEIVLFIFILVIMMMVFVWVLL